MGKAVIVRVLAMLAERARDEQRQHQEHPADDYQRGRWMATKGLREEIFRILENS